MPPVARRLPLLAATLVALLFTLLVATPARADASPPPEPIPAAAAAVPLDPEAATRAYLDTVPPDAHARSDAYFEGGYWLILVDFLASSAIALLLLFSGASAKMRAYAARITRRRPLQVALYWLQYVVATSALAFPLTLYRGFFREHAYGLSNMTFAAWLSDEAKGLAFAMTLGTLAMMALYAILARAKRTWWIWGAVASVAIIGFAMAIAPVFVMPAFNKYTAVQDEAVRAPILALARSNGIEAKDVYEFDASKQSKRGSANVSGFGATMRISLNDNLLKRCSLPEIEAVMGHEMGHYVLGHIPKGIVQIGIILVLGFAFVRALFDRLRARFAARWQVTGVDDPAGLPLLGLLLGVYMFAMTPVLNTIVRTQEAEADLFGVNTSRQPDAMAQVALKLGEYRKLDPGPLEEILFFDHPSGRNRILMAMRWKAEHVGSTPLR